MIKRFHFILRATLLIIISVTILITVFSSSCSIGSQAGNPETIIIGGSVSDSFLPYFVGEDKKIFLDNGIKPNLKFYDTGLAAMDDLLNKKIDIAGISEYAVVVKAFKNTGVKIIGTFDKAYIIYLVGNIEHGIQNEADLKGKKIGLSRGTIIEFYLGRFLLLHNMTLQDVNLINLPPDEIVKNFLEGDIDAAITLDPFISQIIDEMKNKTIIWQAQNYQALYGSLACRNDWIEQNKDKVLKILKSYVQADDFINDKPSEAKRILKEQFQYNDAYIAKIWNDHQFISSLEQSLILAMEDEARWMIGNNLTTEMQVPNFLEYINEDMLRSIKPEATNIIR